MAKYIWDTVTATAPFAGFTPNYLVGACLSKSLPWAGVAEGGTATKVGFYKMLMKSTAAGMVFACAGTSHKIKATALTGTAATFLEFISMVKPTAYTAAMKVHAVSAYAGNGGTATKCKFWIDAYDSAGIRVAAVACGTAPAGVAPTGFVATFPTTASTLAKFVTVPVGGFLGFRLHPNAMGTVRMYGGAGWSVGGAMVLNTVETAAITGASVENRERFHDSTGTPLADGTKVYEYDATTMAYTGIVGTIGGAAVGSGAAEVGVLPAAVGVGEVVFTRANSDIGEYFYIIPDPASGNAWILNTVYALGAKVNPLSLAKLYAEVTTAGTSGATEPAWDTLSLVKGSTVVDGTVTWTMVDVETICTNAVQGYQLGHWTAGMTAVIAAVGVTATIIAPTDSTANQHAVCTAITTGLTGATEPVWTGLATGSTVVDGGVTWTITADKAYD